MKKHWSLKLVAFLLAMVSAVLVVCGGVGMLFSEECSYVENRVQVYNYSEVRAFVNEAANYVLGTYAQQKSGTSEAFFREYIYWDYPRAEELAYPFDYRITDNSGRTLANTRGSSANYSWERAVECYVVHSTTVEMPELSWYPEYDEYTGYYAENDVEFPELTAGTYAYAYGYENGKLYRIDYSGTDYYTVEICLAEETVEALGSVEFEISDLIRCFRDYSFRLYLMAVLVGVVVLLLSLVWLCSMAGKAPDRDGIHPGGLNALPLDIYGVILLAVAGLLIAATMWLVGRAVYIDYGEIWLWVMLMICDGVGCGLGLALACMAITAQVRVGGGFWLRNTLIGRCWDTIRGVGRKAVSKVLGWFGVAVNSMNGILPPVGKMLRQTVEKIPLIWQWVLAYGGLFAFTVWVASTFRRHGGFVFFVVAIFGFPLVAYSAYAFGKLRDAAHRMAQGRLDAKIDVENDRLHGCFREFAGDLNELGDVCVAAAREQMKHERMKSELITNVSHDIKTPLTSIINYVDLLQKAESQQQREEYLEVLERQSQRLKKLIEDLMEMSKASSGNIAVDIQPTDVNESVNQALGEFADALESCGLKAVLRQPAGPVMADCDGKLLWRVLSNVLSNVVKYAMPGTRVYVDVASGDGRVEISVKNISRDPLNITADELMERFVRGDESRNTEGNGLGLNIARSLMAAQRGSLDLVVDGDLFKVILTLPGVA